MSINKLRSLLFKLKQSVGARFIAPDDNGLDKSSPYSLLQIQISNKNYRRERLANLDTSELRYQHY